MFMNISSLDSVDYKKKERKQIEDIKLEKRHDRVIQGSEAWIVGLDMIKIHCITPCMKITKTKILCTCI